MQSSQDGTSSLPVIYRPSTGQAVAAEGGLPVKGQLFPPLRNETKSKRRDNTQAQSSKKPATKGGKLVISYPIIQEDMLADDSPLKRIATVDLNTAAQRDRERRKITGPPMLRGPPGPPSRPLNSAGPLLGRQDSQTIERKQVAVSESLQSAKDTLEAIRKASSQGVSSSMTSPTPVPSASGIRQRSPKHVSQFMRADAVQTSPTTASTALSPRRESETTVPPKIPPRSPMRPPPEISSHASISISEVLSTAGSMQPPGSPSTQPESFTAQSPPAPTTLAALVPSHVASDEKPTDASIADVSSASGKFERASNKALDVLVPPVAPLSPKKFQAQKSAAKEGSLPGQNPVSQTLQQLPRSGSVKHDIRPSRQRPTTPPKGEEAKQVKTPVQLRKAAGLPNNPRAQAAKDADAGEEGNTQTVMFVNEHANDGPMSHTPKNRTGQAGWEASGDGDSVVNRPRPIPRRKSSESLSAEASIELPKTPKRINSISSMDPSKNQSFTSANGSAQVPPVPPVPPLPTFPTSILKKARPLPPTKNGIAQSAPSIQASKGNLASVGFARGLRTIDEPNQLAAPPPRSQASANSRMMLPPQSTQMTAVPGRQQHDATKYVSTFSIATTISPVEDPTPPYLPSPGQTQLQSPQDALERRSSPMLASDNPHGPVTKRTPSADGPRSRPALTLAIPPMPDIVSARSSFADEDDGKEIVTVMLDRSTDYPTYTVDTPPPNRIYGGVQGRKGSWHRRIGESCPTFSDRNAVQSRRFPRPPPLELHRSTRRFKEPPAPVQAPPLETPQYALDMIQEQLKKFEQPDTEGGGTDKQRMALLADIETEMGMQENQRQKMQVDLSRASFSTIASNSNTPAASTHNSPIPSRLMQLSELGGTKNSSEPEYTNARETDNGRPRSSLLLTADKVQISRPTGLPTNLDMSNVGLSPQEFEDTVPNVVTLSEGEETFASGNKQRAAESSRKSDLWQRRSQVEGGARVKQESLWNSAPDDALGSVLAEEQGSRPISRRSSGRAPSAEDTFSLNQTSRALQSDSRSLGLWKAALGSSAPNKAQPVPASRPRTIRPPRRGGRISALPDIVESPEPLENKRGTLGIFQFPWGEKSDTARLPMPLPSQRISGAYMNMISGTLSTYPTLEAQMQSDPAASVFDYYDDEEIMGYISDGSDEEVVDDNDDDSFDETTLWEIASLLKSDKVPSRQSLFPAQEGISPASSIPQLGSVSSASFAREVGTEQHTRGMMVEQEFVQSPARRETTSPTIPPQEAATFEEEEDIYVNTQARNEEPHQSEYHLGTLPESPKPLGVAQDNFRVNEEMTQLEENALWSTPRPGQPISVGLPQPELNAWIRYNNMGHHQTMTKAKRADLPRIESQSLWNQSPETTTSDAQSPKVEETVINVSDSAFGDEEEPSSVTGEILMAFAQSAAGSPAANDAEAWSQEYQDVTIAAEPSMPKSSVLRVSQHHITGSAQSSSNLWSYTPANSSMAQSNGLFERQHGPAQDQRGTGQAPAALETRPTPRASRPSLASLHSDTLWTAPVKQTFAQDWVTLSSVRPGTPQGQASSDSDSESAFSETSSSFSSITGESSLGSFFTSQATSHSKHRPVPNADQMHLPESVSRSQEQTDISESEEAKVQISTNERPLLPEMPNETVENGRAKSILDARRHTQTGGFDPARHHPVFNVYMLDASVGEAHPAAQGYINTLVNYNPDLIDR